MATGMLDPHAPLDGEATIDFSLRSALLTTLDRLQEAAETYGAASATLADATVRDSAAREASDFAVAAARMQLYADGVPGANEAQRQAHLAYRLATSPQVAALHRAHAEAQEARTQAEHHFRVADVAQKALRVRAYALSALLGVG
jgi:hypothetical protein